MRTTGDDEWTGEVKGHSVGRPGDELGPGVRAAVGVSRAVDGFGLVWAVVVGAVNTVAVEVGVGATETKPVGMSPRGNRRAEIDGITHAVGVLIGNGASAARGIWMRALRNVDALVVWVEHAVGVTVGRRAAFA